MRARLELRGALYDPSATLSRSPRACRSRGSALQHTEHVALRFGDCELREELFELQRKGQPVRVEPKVLQLIIYLLHHRARSVTRSELLGAIWADVKVGDASLTRAIVEARRAIGDEAQEMIVTVHLDGISAPCRDVLSWASVLGKTFGFTTLSKVAALEPDALLDRLGDRR